MIKAESLSYDAVINSLVNGHFYSSMGPEIKELYMEGRELVVKTGPVKAICGITDSGRFCRRAAVKGEPLTEARFLLKGNETYIRVECKDEKGLFANSNAYFLSGLE